MSIFRKRPLCMILCMMLGGFALFWKVSGMATLLLFLAVLGGSVLTFLFRRKAGIFPSVLLAFLSLSFLLSHLYFDLWFFADRRIDGEHEIHASVTEIAYAKSYGAAFTVETEPIGDIPFSRYRLLIHTTAGAASLTVGEKIRFRAEILPSDTAGETNDELSLLADGISGYAEIDNYTVLSEGKSHPLRLLSRLRATVQDWIEKVAGESTPLFSALFLGDKSGLSGTERLDFRRIGISHLLAVSGMHLAILSAFLHRFLALFGVGKKFRVGAVSLFALFYMALTGFSPSVLRAGVMLLIASALFLLAGTSDSLTTLSLAVILLCLFKPYAIFDVSLLLSALATLGILVAPMPKETKWRHPLRHLFFSCTSSVFFSFFAIGATLAVTVFIFGRISLLSAFSTLIFGCLVEAFMIFGLLSLPFGLFLPTEIPLTYLSDLILRLAGTFSDLPGIYCAADFPIVRILTVVFSLGFFLFLVLPVKHRRCAICGLLLLFLTVFVGAGICSHLALSQDKTVYLSDGQKSECIVTHSKARVSALLSPNDITKLSDDIEESHITEIDILLFSSYSSKIPALLRSVTANVKLRCVVLPRPRDNDERFLLYGIERTLAASRTECRLVSPGTTAKSGDAAYCFLSREEKRTILTLSVGGNKIAYISRGAAADDDMTKEAFRDAKAIVFGCYGTRYSSAYRFAPASDAKAAHRVLLGSNDVSIDENEKRAYLAGGNYLLLRPQKVRLQ